MQDEMNILREVGSTAAAHGSIALSQMLRRKITLNVPSVSIIPVSKIADIIKTSEPAIVLQSKILSGLAGKVIYVLDEKSSYKFVDIYEEIDPDFKKEKVFTQLAISLIKEIGNVVISAYIGTLGYYLKKLIISSLPVLINAPLADAVRIIVADYNDDDQVMIIESNFEEPKAKISGNFWLILTPDAALEITRACKKILDNI